MTEPKKLGIKAQMRAAAKARAIENEVVPYESFTYFAPCASGLEPMLADELRDLGIKSVRPQRAGVAFRGTLKSGYKVCLWSRLASRVLLALDEVQATTADELYENIKKMEWEKYLMPNGTLSVDSTGMNSELRNTQFTNVRVKDGVVDRMRQNFGTRPSVNTENPDVRINVLVRDRTAKISIDLSGEPLHRRKYREQGIQVTAPMKESLAAAMLHIANWPEIASKGGAFVDFMCGSATLPIEAAMMAADIAPGLHRKHWGFERWRNYDETAWSDLLSEARARRAAGLKKMVPIVATDIDARAVDVARRAVRRAELEDYIHVGRLDLRTAEPPSESDAPGLIALNPPYGERLAESNELFGLYHDLAEVTRARFMGWSLAIMTPDAQLAFALKRNPRKVRDLYNGRILAPVSVFTVGEEEKVTEASARAGRAAIAGDSGSGMKPATNGGRDVTTAIDVDTTDFENRLKKMKKHFTTWARRTGVSCYRVYDADLPDFNFAIDLYEGVGVTEGRTWIHIAEYMPPAEIDPRLAVARMDAALTIAAEVFDVPEIDVILKRRQRQRGTSQYERSEGGQIIGIVEEAGLRFEVNMTEYLDTGIFLDHRDTRAWIREEIRDKSFLNLFAYTGVVSVFAAAGGAASTTTVDLSHTYLDMAKRNMARNGYTTENQQFVHSDVLGWIDRAYEQNLRYDFIFCDPPTFSNSKRMEETWDVSRDHLDLVVRTARLLEDGGELFFSCNKRGFKIDIESLMAEGLSVQNVTKRTIPKDFERNPHVHTCFIIKRDGTELSGEEDNE